MKFAEFEKSIKNNKESYEKWDGYIEWKAYQHKLDDLNKQYAGNAHNQFGCLKVIQSSPITIFQALIIVFPLVELSP